MFGAVYFGQTYLGQGYPAEPISVPEWVSPPNHDLASSTDNMVFIIPVANSPPHFELQIDTADTFDTVDLITVRSWLEQNYWQYYDGSSWQTIPSNGVPLGYIGNQARYNGLSLSTDKYYRRIRARIKV